MHTSQLTAVSRSVAQVSAAKNTTAITIPAATRTQRKLRDATGSCRIDPPTICFH
jgi:hypothetical protein